MSSSALTVIATPTVVVGPTVQSISVASDRTVWAATVAGQVLQNTEDRQAWMSVPGTASWLSVSPEANQVCAISNGTPVYCSLQPLSAWATLSDSPPADLTSIEIGMGSATDQDTIYAIDTGHLLWTYNATNGNWTQTTNSADQIAATSDGAVFRLDGGALTQFDWTTAQWTSIVAPESLTAVGAGAAGWLWVVGASGKVYQFDGSSRWIGYAAPAPAGATAAISCGDDTTVWALAGGAIYRFDPSTSGWSLLPSTGAGTPTFISVGDNQNAWVLNSNPSDNILRHTEHLAMWEEITGSGLPDVRQLSAADDSTLWVVDPSANVYTLTRSDGEWTASAADGVMAWVAASADGTVWAIDDGGAAYERAGSSWQQRSTSPVLSRIAVANAEQVAAIGIDGTVYTWSPAPAAWTSLPPTNQNDPLVSVSIMSGGALWAVGKSGLLYLWLDQWINPWSPTTLLTQVSGTAEDVWAIDTSGAALQLADGGLREGTSPHPGLPGWDAKNMFVETQSTHLWIVNRAAALAQQQGQAGQRIFSLVKPFQEQIGDGFHDALCTGLYQADFEPEYNNPVMGKPTFSSHFYDPDTGKNWLQQSSPTAVGNSASYFAQALDAYLTTPRNSATVGYYLGLALHYMTDLTQPMHAANFTWLASSPKMTYHGDFETYIMEIQATVNPPGAYVPSTYGTNPTPFLIAVAKNSKYKYFAKIVTSWAIRWYWGFTSYYKELAQDNIGAIMKDAITFTAQYLVAWMQAACTVHAISVTVDSAETKQMCCLDGAGGLWWCSWPLNGQMSPWAPVAPQMKPDCGPKTAVAAATASDGTLFVFVIADDTVQYTTMSASGVWSGTWTPVSSLFPSNPAALVSLDCTVDGQGAVQVTLVDAAGTLWHTMLPAGGDWQWTWGNVAGQESNDFGAKSVVACAGDGTGGLNVVALQKSNGAPWYTYRAASGAWNSSWLSLNQTIPPARSFTTVSCAVDSSQTLQVAALDSSGGLWHTDRASSGTWQSFWGQVSTAVPGTSPSTIVTAGAFANLWLVAVTTLTGTPMMAERYAGGTGWKSGWWSVGQPPV